MPEAVKSSNSLDQSFRRHVKQSVSVSGIVKAAPSSTFLVILRLLQSKLSIYRNQMIWMHAPAYTDAWVWTWSSHSSGWGSRSLEAVRSARRRSLQTIQVFLRKVWIDWTGLSMLLQRKQVPLLSMWADRLEIRLWTQQNDLQWNCNRCLKAAESLSLFWSLKLSQRTWQVALSRNRNSRSTFKPAHPQCLLYMQDPSIQTGVTLPSTEMGQLTCRKTARDFTL